MTQTLGSMAAQGLGRSITQHFCEMIDDVRVQSEWDSGSPSHFNYQLQ
ncbi:hypothetical protein JOY44_17175 [Phormidium sp. CLA17]|nr:hypothetical protein [Leptolyngbya sp. Cla-17]MBM0743325.1 hypothetical protein [Leptolyngbya sp. Cla-17]